MKNIAVFASGGGTNFQAVVDACAQGKIDGKVVVLIHNRKDAYAKTRAEQAGIPTRYINKIRIKDSEVRAQVVLDTLDEFQADILVLAGYLDILHPSVIARYRNRIINTHPALIPAFCGDGFYGEHVHNAVLQFGAKVSGCTIHLVDEGTDTGPIMYQQSVPVLQEDDAHTLAARILPHEHRLLVQAVQDLCTDNITVQNRRVYFRKENKG